MKRAHVLTEREIKRVFAHSAERPFAGRNRAMFQLSIYAGMRVGEIAALLWGDVFTPEPFFVECVFNEEQPTMLQHPPAKRGA